MASKGPAKKQIKHSKQKDYKFVLYGALAALAIILYYYCKAFDFIQDDSYITYRYVKNFTEGHGLVFNIGEKVEGYTCFLWVIVLALTKKIGFNFISASQTIGILSSVVSLVFTYLISAKFFSKEKGGIYNITFCLIAPALLAANGSFAYWSVSGMETGLFGILLTLAVYFYLKEMKNTALFPYSSAIFLLASLTRPEGNLIFAVTVLHKIILTLKKKGDEKPRLLTRNNFIWLGLYLVPAVVFMIWRYSYYGYLFPNTFYAKTGSSLEYFKTGWDYFVEFAKNYGLYGLLLILPFVTLRPKQRFYEYLYLILVFYVFSVYVIFIGGDVLRPNRFFVPLLPVFFILVQEGLHNLITLLDRKNTFAYGTVIGVIFAIGFAYFTYKNEFDTIKKYSDLEKGLVEKMKISGTWLKTKQTSAGKPLVVAATTIGAVSYYSDVTLIDMLGLTDKEVAHNPRPIPEISSKEVGWRERNYNVEYILSRKPDYIYFSTGIKPSAYAERGLFTSDEFLNYYYPYYFSIKDFSFSDIIYKRKPELEASKSISSASNPNYKKSFVNLFNQAMNTTKDKTKLNDAIGLYQQSIVQGPSNWSAPYQMLGEIYLQQNNKNKAFESYQKAVELDDYNVMSHYYLYELYLEKGDTVNAKLNIDKLKQYSPDIFN